MPCFSTGKEKAIGIAPYIFDRGVKKSEERIVSLLSKSKKKRRDDGNRKDFSVLG